MLVTVNLKEVLMQYDKDVPHYIHFYFVPM